MKTRHRYFNQGLTRNGNKQNTGKNNLTHFIKVILLSINEIWQEKVCRQKDLRRNYMCLSTANLHFKSQTRTLTEGNVIKIGTILG